MGTTHLYGSYPENTASFIIQYKSRQVIPGNKTGTVLLIYLFKQIHIYLNSHPDVTLHPCALYVYLDALHCLHTVWKVVGYTYCLNTA